MPKGDILSTALTTLALLTSIPLTMIGFEYFYIPISISGSFLLWACFCAPKEATDEDEPKGLNK